MQTVRLKPYKVLMVSCFIPLAFYLCQWLLLRQPLSLLRRFPRGFCYWIFWARLDVYAASEKQKFHLFSITNRSLIVYHFYVRVMRIIESTENATDIKIWVWKLIVRYQRSENTLMTIIFIKNGIIYNMKTNDSVII